MNHNMYRYRSVQARKDQFLDRSSQFFEIVFVMKALPAQVPVSEPCNVCVSTSRLQQTNGTRHMGPSTMAWLQLVRWLNQGRT